MIGKTVSHYRILEKLGEGGMGVVYKAEDLKLKRTVALKFLPPELMKDPEAKQRFIQEAQAAAALDHPNICTVYEIEETEGQTFISMAYIEGQNLKEKVESGPPKLEEALDIGMQVAEGLQAAHEKGIVHRDIKLANIIVTTKGQVKIMDFGLAKLRGGRKLPKEGRTLGTVAYMSPEQVRGEGVDERTDIWSLGVMLYEMVTGRLPFQGEYEQAVIYSILNEEPEPVGKLRSGVLRGLEGVIGKMLAKDVRERYQGVGELLVDLRSLRGGLGSAGLGPSVVGSVGARGGILVKDERVEFREAKDSLRVMLAQISPGYDEDVFAKEGLVRVRDGERQAEKVLKVIEYAHSLGVDVLLFPELAAPFGYLEAFEEALGEGGRDLVANICYEHTRLRDLERLLGEGEREEHGLGVGGVEGKLVNFCRIWIRAGGGVRVYTQMKLTPFSSEFSLLAKESLVCGRVLHRFITNWGNFLFLICKDYVGEVRVEGRVPMFDFLKSLTEDGLHWVFVSALNSEPEAFIHAARAFYYLQEKSSETFTVILNAAELDHTTVVFPVRPHPKIRTAEGVEMTPLFKGKPSWGTQLRFPGCQEKVISGTFHRLDKYSSMPTKEVFSPFYGADLLDLSQLGIEVEPIASQKAVPIQQKVQTPSVLHNLPPQPTAFLGREKELREIAQLLADPSCRLLTLLGPGGMGKTRLALQAAYERVGEFPQGVFFIPLGPLTSAEFLVSTIANVLKYSLYSGEDPKVQLLNYLGEKEMLLVMDNFEHLLEGAGLLGEILEAAPKVKLIVTSRQRLNLWGEWIYEVGGMSLPPDEVTGAIGDYSGVQLFLQTAQRIHPGFSLSPEEAPFVVRICRLVEGMPLGIELAAAWVRMLSCREIAQEMKRSIDFLATTLRDMPERHRSLRAVLEGSWGMLSETERWVFMRISIFRGGFSREAAERVAGASLGHLSALVDKSFVRRCSSNKYELHELMRQYGEEKLREAPEERYKVEELHCKYYAEFVHRREGDLKGRRQREALGEIGEEIENVRRGWNWAVEEGRQDEVAKYVEGLYQFYVMRGLLQEGEGAFGRAVERLGGEVETIDEQRSQTLGRLLARQGVFSCHLCLYEKAKGLLERGLLIFRKLGLLEEIGFCLNSLGEIDYRLGRNMEGAKRLIEESLTIRRKIGDQWGIARSLNNLGNVLAALGNLREAKQVHQESLTLRKQMGDLQGEAISLHNLAYVTEGMGEFNQARCLYQESLDIAREVGDRRQIILSLNNLGYIAWAIGEYEEARRLHLEGLMMSNEIGHRWGRAYSLGGLGNVANTLREYGEAEKILEESLTISREIGYQWVTTVSLEHLGNLAYRRGKYERAEQLYREGLSIAQGMGTRWGIASFLNGLGNVAYARGEHQESKRYWLEALKNAMGIYALPLVLDILVGLATFLAREGEREKSLELLALVLHHPSTYRETNTRGERLRSQFISQLTPQVVQEAEKRGRTRKLAEVVEEILGSEGGTE